MTVEEETMPITVRDEEYLEAMYLLRRSKGAVRLKDIADMLNIRAPTAVEALERLAEKGLIIYEKRGVLDLTPAGEDVAREIYSRHQELKEFFQEILSLPEEVAEEEACRIEHHIRPETLERMARLTRKLRDMGLRVD